MQSVGEIANEAAWHILDGVLTNPIDSGCSDPPKRVLYFVARDLKLFLVHIRQIVAKPTVKGVADFVRVAVGRKQRTIMKLVNRVLRERAVKPIIERRIFYPWILRAHVIGNLILDNFQTRRVRLID